MRHGGRCEPCLEAGRSTQATELDHIVPLSVVARANDFDAFKRALWDEAGCRPICRPCHRAKSDTERKRPRNAPLKLCEHGYHPPTAGDMLSCPYCPS